MSASMSAANSDLRVVIAGAGGRMGRTLIHAVAATKGVTLAGAVDAPGSAVIGRDTGELAGLGRNGVAVTGDVAPLLQAADALIEFTIPAATLVFAEMAAKAGLVHVIGTTGHSAEEEAVIAKAANRATIVKSGNMSLGVNLLAALVKRVARTLNDDYDVEIVEMHHNKKIDAPSGTALMLGRAAAEGRGLDLAQHSVRGRDGMTGAFSPAAHCMPPYGRAARSRDFIRWPTFSACATFDDRAAEQCQTGALRMGERILVLVRHGESEWNLKNLFTGWRDVDLTENGIKEARAAGRKLKAQGIRFDVGFTSALIRAQRSLDLVLEEMGQVGIPVFKDQALNERDYGDLSGLNKDDARKKWGTDQVLLWRRSYDVAPPGGESLKDTAARVLPYYIQEILPRVLKGDNILISAHGNSLRALVMVLEKLSPQQIVKRELATGVPLIYRLNADSTVANKQDLAA